MDASGQLVTADGFRLIPPITIPPDATSFTIDPDGAVTATTPSGLRDLGQITLAQFLNPGGLLRTGNNLFVAAPASGPATVGTPGTDGLGTISQGALENSNVDLTTELVNLLLAQQSVSGNARAFTVGDEMIQATTDLIV